MYQMTDGWLEGLGQFNIQRFAEGGAGEGGAAGGENTGGENTAADAAQQRAKAPTVLYGKQPEAAKETKPDAGAEPTEAASDPDAEFRELINGKYKEQYTKATQGIINKRFAETKGLEESNRKYREMAEKVAARYGVDPQNLDAIGAAIDGDKKFLMEQADKAGMTVDQYRQMQALRAENERFRQMQKAQQEQAEVTRQIDAWRQEAEQVRGVYPQFDMDAEFQNPQFVALVKQRIPMRQAYEVIHHDELMRGMAQYAATAAQKQTIQNIQARGMRPVEGAAQGNPASIVKNDVKKLTKADREEIARQVMRGKTITFS